MAFNESQWKLGGGFQLEEVGYWGYALEEFILSITPSCISFCILTNMRREHLCFAMPVCHLGPYHDSELMEPSCYVLKPLKS